MPIKVLENSENSLKLEIDDLTLVNLLNENLWQLKGTKMAAYAKHHPYIAKPVLVVKGRNPKKLLLDAAEQIIEDASEMRKQLDAAGK